MNIRGSNLSMLTVALLAVGCGGSDPTGPDPDGGGDPGTSTRVIKTAPSFATDINEIFQRNGCSGSGCHGAAGGQAGLMLTASATANYPMLVDAQATSESFLRVAKGDAAASYLVIKLEGNQLVGQRMPRGGTPLDNIDITNIKNWINNGAPQN